MGVLLFIDVLDCWSGTVTDGMELDTGRASTASVVGRPNEIELVGVVATVAGVESVDEIRCVF